MSAPHPTTRTSACAARNGEQGFLLVAVVVMAAILLIFLAVAAPIVAKDLQRERELETVHRGQQYVRAIRLYYRKFQHYPTSIDQLDNSNNIKFLRQHYLDPMTGKDDWRIIHVGENQTTVTGFFGEPLAGLNTTGGPGGLGSAQGMLSTTGGTQTTGQTPSNPFSALWGGTSSTNSTGGSNATGVGGTSGTSGTGSNTTGGSGVQSTDATAFNGSGGGPIMGVSSLSPKQSIIIVHKKSTYDTWEFIYDPRIELLYAKSTSLAGGSIGTNSTSAGSFGTSATSFSGSGNNNSNSNSNSTPNNNSQQNQP
jgi:type II secretory pathway pseudopilin PulG